MAEEQTRDALIGPVTEILSDHGLVLEDLTVRDQGGTAMIRIVVDLPEDRIGSADLDAVAGASRGISELLDEDATLLGSGPSELEVTTPGAERELTATRHFRRSRTRLLRLQLGEGESWPAGELLARLEDVSEDEILQLRPQRPTDSRGRPLRLPEGTPDVLEVPLSAVLSARVEIEFSAPDTRTPTPSKER